jgi:signal transduction histidine kinase
MSIRRQWLVWLTIMAVLAVGVHALFMNILTRNTFTSYLHDRYTQHVKEIRTYVQDALTGKGFSLQQMALELQTHIDDPITQIRLYDAEGNLLLDVRDGAASMDGRMMGRGPGPGGHMRDGAYDSKTDSIPLKQAGVVVGSIQIVHYASIADSLQASNFQAKMMKNTLWTVIVIVSAALVLGVWISRRMSRDLRATALFATQIEEGGDAPAGVARVHEIRSIQEALQALRMKLRLKQKVRKTMLDELVHQTRTPLTILQTRLEALQDGVIPFKPEEAATMHQQVTALTALLSNVNQLMDAHGEVYALALGEVDMQAFGEKIAAAVAPSFKQKGISFHTIIQAKTITTDPHLLSQTLYNIIMNAHKYTEAGGEVKVEGQVAGAAYVWSITDTGRGIAADDLSHVFEAYYRGKSTAEIDGDGLGLYVAEQHVLRLGGTIEVTSSLGAGTSFIIQLPLEQKEVE